MWYLIPLENHEKTPFGHILMNLTNEASCPIVLRLYVIVVGGTFLFSKFLKMFMEFYVGQIEHGHWAWGNLLQKILWSIQGIQFFSGGKKKFNVAIFTSFMFNNLIAKLTYGKCFHIHLLLFTCMATKMTDQACEKELAWYPNWLVTFCCQLITKIIKQIGWYGTHGCLASGYSLKSPLGHAKCYSFCNKLSNKQVSLSTKHL